MKNGNHGNHGNIGTGNNPKPDPKPQSKPDPIIPVGDQEVTLASAPKTGDLSGIWAVISGISLGGITLLNKKREEDA